MININNDQVRNEARAYSRKVADDIEEQGIAYDACLKGIEKAVRIFKERLPEFISKIVDICSYDLNANYNSTEHKEYVNYRLNGGTLSEEDWFNSECI